MTQHSLDVVSIRHEDLGMKKKTKPKNKECYQESSGGWIRGDSRTQEEAEYQVVCRQMKHEGYSGAARPVWMREMEVLVVQRNTKTNDMRRSYELWSKQIK